MDNKITLGTIKSLISNGYEKKREPNYILLDKDENVLNTDSLLFTEYDDIDNIPVNRILTHKDDDNFYIVLDYKPNSLEMLGITKTSDSDIKLRNMLKLMLKTQSKIRVIEKITDNNNDVIFSIYNNEIDISEYFNMLLDKHGVTNEDVEKVKSLRERVKEKISEIMDYYVIKIEYTYYTNSYDIYIYND